jgi:hypothetical protein
VILVDTGPFVALFDPKDPLHERCKATLRSIREPRKVFTLDRGDFSTYRIRRGHRHEPVEIVG